MIEKIRAALNIFNFLRRSHAIRILLVKIFLRIRESIHDESRSAHLWAKENISNVDEFLESIDSTLFKETQTVVQKIRDESFPVIADLSRLDIDLGGGGSLELLYFFSRYLKPDYVLETGVAAGWSSYAILEALKINALGKLDSSDLPYFRIANPEQYIGILVPERLRDSNTWDLRILGDSKNLDHFLTPNKRYGLVHYDSDKRHKSRSNFFKRIEPHVDEVSVIIMDDIQDNLAFCSYVSSKRKLFKIFCYESKFIGVIYPANLLEH